VTRFARIWLAGIVACGVALPSALARAADPAASSDPAVPPKEAGAAAPEAAAPADSEQNVSMFPIKGDKPLSIRSDELEAIEEGGRRRLVFTRAVNVEQADLKVQADRLEALYPPGGDQPDRLIANGRVRVSQRDKTMLCDAATFYQSEDRLVCTGNAELRQGGDRVRGKEIEIFVKQNRVKVRGGAMVNVSPEGENTQASASAPAKKKQ
jgi:lipopolysaccharide export system protein LptA